MILQDGWACPFAGHAPPLPGDELPRIEDDSTREACVDALKTIEERSGAKCATCPRWYYSHTWIREAEDVFTWREKNGVSAVQGLLTVPMIEAVNVLQDAVHANGAWLLKNPEKKK